MIRFNCDYGEGAHEKVLEKLCRTNMEQTPGYGEDAYCREAAELVKRLCDREDVDVHFLVGGTQTNLTVIDAALRGYQGVLCADTGHINVHETGAIEACGHKVLALPEKDGKINAKQVEEAYLLHINDESHEHMVQPKMVYISSPTEVGTLYLEKDLEEISVVCKKYGLYLFLDGARMGYGLASPENDVTLADIAKYCDAFYIGGTKVGAMFGEAVVITNPLLKPDFRYLMKQKGGMLAKGRLLGLQFLALLEDGLYFEIAEHAVKLALKLRDAMREMGYEFMVDSPTNQQFPIIKDDFAKKLKEKYSFSYIQRHDEQRSVIRFCTSWATKEEDVDALIRDLKN